MFLARSVLPRSAMSQTELIEKRPPGEGPSIPANSISISVAPSNMLGAGKVKDPRPINDHSSYLWTIVIPT
jgi:hypothetical protein